jgi:hypothetical protein
MMTMCVWTSCSVLPTSFAHAHFIQLTWLHGPRCNISVTQQALNMTFWNIIAEGTIVWHDLSSTRHTHMHRHKYLTIRKQELDPTLSFHLSRSSYPCIIPHLLLLSWVCLTTQMILRTHTLSLNINPKFYCILKHRAGSSLNISSSTTYQLLLLISYYQEFISLFSHKQYSPLHSFTNIASQYASHPNISHLLTNSFWFPNLYHTLFTQILITHMLGL